MSFVCTRLAGHPCCRYGVEISRQSEGDNHEHEVCEEGQIISEEQLQAGDSIEVNVWFTEDEIPDVECFAWFTSDEKTTENCECGVNNEMTRPKSSEDDLAVSEFPWTVQILKQSKTGGYEFICSGSLIAEDAILTAAHCFADCPSNVDHVEPSTFRVVVGKTDMRDPWDNVFISTVQSIHVPEDFALDSSHPTGDIAVAIMDTKVGNLSDPRTRSVCLPLYEGAEMGDVMGVVSGWGARYAEDAECGYAWFDSATSQWLHSPPKKLNPDLIQSMHVVFMDPYIWMHHHPDESLMEEESHADEFIFATVAEYYEHFPHSCKGDSGSPLMVRDANGKMSLVGVASFGQTGSCLLDEVIGFVRVDNYLDWIRGILGEQC